MRNDSDFFGRVEESRNASDLAIHPLFPPNKPYCLFSEEDSPPSSLGSEAESGTETGNGSEIANGNASENQPSSFEKSRIWEKFS